MAMSHDDPYPGEQRSRTIGMVRTSIVFVVHTWPDDDWPAGDDVGRIISVTESNSSRKDGLCGRTFLTSRQAQRAELEALEAA